MPENNTRLVVLKKGGAEAGVVGWNGSETSLS
jgi:hypothetical protein